MQEVVIFGASGYSGLELLRILAWHPAVTVVAASSDRWAGQSVIEAVPAWRGGLQFTTHESVFEATRSGQIALLATPATTSADLAPRLLERGLRVVDLSGAFRLEDPEEYERWYGFRHPAPALLAEAQYGLPELLPISAEAKLVANPGCYATAAVMAVAPLLAADLLDGRTPVIVDGKSGTTGAGRSAKEGLLHAEVTENLRSYRVAKHQHTPEIERALWLVAQRNVHVSFTAHLIPMRRGILASAYMSPRGSVGETDVRAAYERMYGDKPFVRYVERPPETSSVRDSNRVEIGATLDGRTGVLCVFAAIDNLMKGAAGQAVQNLNRLIAQPEHAGLLPTSEGPQ